MIELKAGDFLRKEITIRKPSFMDDESDSDEINKNVYYLVLFVEGIKAFCYGLKKYLDDSMLLNTQVIKNYTGTDFKSFMKWWNAYEQSDFSELDKMAYHQLNSNEDF